MLIGVRGILTLLRDRLLVSVCPEGARCQHRGLNGQLCSALLDRRGRHARVCKLGGGVDRRHNGVRDWAASTYAACTGLPTSTEQRVPAWDIADAATGAVLEARLDVATADVNTGAPLYLDVVVYTAFSTEPTTLRRRARRDGCAASDAAAAKRRRYAAAGAQLVPFALEAGGRPSDEAAAFVRLCGSVYAETHKSEDGAPAPSPTWRLWKGLSTVLQRGNAELILSAIGR